MTRKLISQTGFTAGEGQILEALLADPAADISAPGARRLVAEGYLDAEYRLTDYGRSYLRTVPRADILLSGKPPL